MTSLHLTTEGLKIRAFTPADTEVIHRVLDRGFGDGTLIDDAAAIADRRSWVQWQALNASWSPAPDSPRTAIWPSRWPSPTR